MAAALEERCSLEIINQDEAIQALKKENKTLEAEKAHLAEDVRVLPSVRQEVIVLKKEKEELELGAANLWKCAFEAVTAKDLAI